MLADFGIDDRARGLLDSVPSGFDSADYRFTLAEIGNAEIRHADWYGGQANQLSQEITSYPRIDEIHRATKLSPRACCGIAAAEPAKTQPARFSPIEREVPP